jgi:hypothetical protein
VLPNQEFPWKSGRGEVASAVLGLNSSSLVTSSLFLVTTYILEASREQAMQQSTGILDLRTHSLRKYFKTQLLALGVQPDYVDYMMGHTVDTYDDIQSLGVDKLRNIYAIAGLSIRTKTHVNKVEALKEMIRALGMNPEQYLSREALAEGAITHRSQEDFENQQLAVLRSQLKQLLRQEAT